MSIEFAAVSCFILTPTHIHQTQLKIRDWLDL